MHTLKKNLGIVWMLLSPAIVFFMLWQAFLRINEAAPDTKANTALQWSIILLVFIPICIGFFMFGRYAYHGEYGYLPQSSLEIQDEDEDPLDL